MPLDEVVLREIQRNRTLKILQFLAKAVRESSESAAAQAKASFVLLE